MNLTKRKSNRLALADASSKEWTRSDLKKMVKGIIEQVKNEPHDFDAYKFGGTISWFYRERPNDPVTKYFKAKGGVPNAKGIVDDLKIKFGDLLVEEGILESTPSNDQANKKNKDTGSNNNNGSKPENENPGNSNAQVSSILSDIKPKYIIGGTAGTGLILLAYYMYRAN